MATRRISLLHHAPALVLLLIVVANSGQWADPDLWGHLRYGQAALTSGHVIANDPYSYSAPGSVWRDHEWLTEIVMAVAYNNFGVVGLKLWKFACVAATVVLTALAMAETGASATIQLNLLGVAALAMVLQNQFRPQLFSFMLLAATLALLARDNYRGRAPVWLMIPMMALWSNLHGGFIVAIAALGAYSGVVGLQDLIAGRGFARALRLGLITWAGTMATLISPYGFGAWRVVIHALKNNAAHPIISDWQPLMRTTIAQWQANPPTVIFFVCGIAIMAAFVITFACTPRDGDLPLVAIAAIMTVGAIAAVRNMPLAAIACMAPTARHFELIAARWRGRNITSPSIKEGAAAAPRVDQSSMAQSGLRPWLGITVAIVLAAVTGMFSPWLAVDVREYPIGAVTFMKQHHIYGNVLGNFVWGQYLIWHLEPDSKVFMDGRYDTVYPQPIIDQYLEFVSGQPAGSKVLRAYPHDLILMPLKTPVVSMMESAPGWKLVYRDGNCELFARADSAAAKLSDGPIVGVLPRKSVFP
jgi:hypothetical protein